MSIQQYLDKIKNAVYGREVRGAIHDAIKQTYDDAAEGGDANMEVKMARGTFPNLNARLDTEYNQLSSQLAQKATKEELQDVESRKMDKNTTDIGIYQINKNKGLIDETYLSEELLQQIAGNTPIHSVPADRSITEVKIAKKAITPEVTSFAKSKNLFKGTYAPSNIWLGGDLETGKGLIQEGLSNYHTAFVEVVPGNTYTITTKGNNRFKIGATTEEPGINVEARIIYFDDSKSKATVTVTENERYLVIYIGRDTTIDWLQVEEGEESTPYSEEQEVYIKPAPQSLNVSQIKNVQPTAILTGPSWSFSVDIKNQKIVTLSSGWINCGTKSYRLKDGEFSYANSTGYTAVVVFDTNTSDLKFLTSTELENSTHPIVGIIRKNEGFVQINGVHEVLDEKEDVRATLEDLFIHDDYLSLNEDRSVPSRSEITSDYIWGIFDDLVDDFPSRVSSSLFGKASDGSDILMYEIKPPQLFNDAGSLNDFPKVFIHAGIHGHECDGVLTVARFFDNLLRKWKDNKELRKLLFNVHFIVVPVMNPWGLDNYASGGGGVESRKNANGVDLNRNFPSGWTYEPDETSMYYAGEEPLSEPETQAMYNFIQDNKSDIIYEVGVHNFGRFPDDENYAMWYGASDENVKKMIKGVGMSWSAALKSEYQSIDDIDNSLIRITTPLKSGAENEWHEAGVISTLLELPREINGSDIADGKKLADKMSQESLGNLILGLINKYPYLK